MGINIFPKIYIYILVWISRYARASLSRDPRTGVLFLLHAKADSRLISQTSTCIGKGEKKESHFRHDALFISFYRVLTNGRRIKPNIGAGAGWASLIYTIRRACIIGASAKFSSGENSALRRYGPFERRSRILLGEVSTVTSIRHVRSAGNLAHDWSLFEASYDVAIASWQLYTRESY